ncbi:MAG: glycosyltransferase [Burkholderiaceae bacterium]|nr:glycosyltransferase [Burkholderiaceae bacterium]
MKTQRKIVVGFIVYKPENGFIERLKRTIGEGFYVYVFDNSPSESSVRDFCLEESEIKYLTLDKNVGLGLGLRSICTQAYYEGNSTLIFFDQDTVYQPETLDFIEKYYLSHLELEAVYSAIIFGADSSIISSDKGCFQDVDVAINSGSLFFLKNLKRLGWHNEKYFVDGVDYEFCLNSKRSGMKVGTFMCTPGFDHSTEQADEKYKILQKTYVFRAYPLFRIIDVTKSSFKLILSALLSLELKFAAMILKFFSVFMVFQLLSRILKPIK